MKKRDKREHKKRDRGIVDFMMIINHFFHSLKEWILEMEDPRNQSYITYTQADLTYMGILKNVCGQHSMREMEEMPHYDTLNYYLEKLSPECLADLRKKMICSLIRGKSFHKRRLLGKYWRVILDGTGFIENEAEDVSKQDCELNATKRLLKKLKKDYPKFPICIQGDALYAMQPFMKLCKNTYHWEYLFTPKIQDRKSWMKVLNGSKQER